MVRRAGGAQREAVLGAGVGGLVSSPPRGWTWCALGRAAVGLLGRRTGDGGQEDGQGDEDSSGPTQAHGEIVSQPQPCNSLHSCVTVLPMALEHALLVALREQPASGLELAGRFARSIGFFWSATHQQIYRVLARMERDGWVRVTEVAQSGRPDKKVYDVTPAGARGARRLARRARRRQPAAQRGRGQDARRLVRRPRRGARRGRGRAGRPPPAPGPLPAARGPRLPRPRSPRRAASSTTTSCSAAASRWSRPGSPGSPTYLDAHRLEAPR